MKKTDILQAAGLLSVFLITACNPQSEPAQSLDQFTTSNFRSAENSQPKQIDQIQFVMDVDENSTSIQGLLSTGVFTLSDLDG